MTVLDKAIGWLAPSRCLGCGLEGRVLCVACESSEILPYGERCWRCGATSPGCRACPACRRFGGPRYVWVTTNYSGLASQLVKFYKFGHHRPAAAALASLMADNLKSYDPGPKNYLVTAMPSASNRVRQRGFDHALLLGRQAAERLRMPFWPLLARLGQASQLGSPRDLRLKQNLDKFFVRRAGIARGRAILLVDDVVTTGGSLKAATRALRAAGAKRVDALVFAKKL